MEGRPKYCKRKHITVLPFFVKRVWISYLLYDIYKFDSTDLLNNLTAILRKKAPVGNKP